MRFLQYGIGAIGSLMTRLFSQRLDIDIVGAIDEDPSKIGRDLGEVAGLHRDLGIKITNYANSRVGTPDVALHATTAFAECAYPMISSLLTRGISVVTITQELFFPLGKNIEIASELDRQAKQSGAKLTAVGVNPGFILDMLPIACSSPCWEIDRISGRRVVDFSPYGPDEMRHIGAGLTEQEFIEGAVRGEIGHIGPP